MDKYEKILQQEALINRLACTNARELADNVRLIQETSLVGAGINLRHLVEDGSINRLMQNEGVYFNSAASVAEAMRSNHNLDGIQKIIQNAISVNSAASVAEVMRCCSEIKRSMMGIGAWKELSTAVESVRSVYENPVLSSFVKESQKMNQNIEQFGKSILSEPFKNQTIIQMFYEETMSNSMMMEERFRSTIDMTNSASQIAEMFKNNNINNLRISNILANKGCISDLSGYISRLYENPDLVRDLCVAVDVGNNLTELDDIYGDEEVDFSEIQINEFIEVIKSSNYAEKIGSYIEKYGIKGKLLICAVMVWLLQQFVSGFVNYCSAPIYRMMAPSFLSQEAISDTAKIEIPVNTDVLVWGDVTNNYISITYEIDGSEFSGYITKEELENNAEKIANEVKWEHIVFVEEVVKFFAESWNINPEDVYNYLNVETNLIDTYLLEHYEVLKELDNAERLKLFKKYCKDKDIDVKGYFLKKAQEDKSITLKSIVNTK